MSTIQQAVKEQNCRMLKLLVAIPGAFSMRDAERGLLVAADNGFVDCVDILLRAGVSPDTTDSSRGSALSLAAASGHVEIVRLLAAAGCNVNMRCCGSTALHRAISHAQNSCVAALIEAGANVNAVDSSGNTALVLAAKNCRQSLSAMKHLITAGCKLDCLDSDRRTALHHASYRAVGTELLLSAGALTNVQDCDGNAPIHLAAIEGFDTIIRCLVTYNCDPNVVNDVGKMAIHYLAMKGHWQAIDDIARVGGDLDRPDGEGNIPLWHAVRQDRKLAVRTLLLANCSPHPEINHGGVPLYEALQQRRYLMAQWLLLAGASLTPLRSFVNEMYENASKAEFVDEQIANWLTAWAREPHSLRQLCRTAIREVLRAQRFKLTNGLSFNHLPPALHDFVSLRELDDQIKHWTVVTEEEID